MSGFFTALHANCDTGQAETKQRQGARLWNLGGFYHNEHIIVVIVYLVVVVQAQDEPVFPSFDNGEVLAVSLVPSALVGNRANWISPCE